MIDINMDNLETPCYLVDESLLIKNLETLKYVIDKSDCRILLAQKAFSMFSVYPLISQYLHGTTASGLYEAMLGYDFMGKPFGKETHIFAPAFLESEFPDILKICDHIVFNSLNQWNKYKKLVNSDIECGLRINPEYSEIETDLYNPCISGSRLGIKASELLNTNLNGISGLHFHTMCEQNSDTLERTLDVVEQKFGSLLHQMKWMNFGGGHHITRPDYNLDTLISSIIRMRDKYNLIIYLEPGEAVALNTGYLIASVLDIVENDKQIAILDASAACHMPDVLEMPYRPHIINSGMPDEKAYQYRLAGNTCLAGDVIGDYSFDAPLCIGDKLFFTDMAHYTMVKNNTFNGMRLPSICIYSKDNHVKTIKKFSYDDFKCRLS